ncbi:MAG: hypothetical protein RIQ89_1037 [Bacteroidota bacterium]|jgi:transketolase
MQPKSNEELKKIASQVRRDIIRQVADAASGHPGGSLGCADLLTALYFKVMNRKQGFDMHGKDEDLFFLSNGHISPLFYSILARAGYFPVSELATFRKLNSRLQGHPTTHEGLPGVRMASGSLGQGLSVALGAATSKKLNNDTNLVFCLCGDGEMQEGQIWEAIMYGAAKKVDNLILIIDFNGQQIDGSIAQVLNYGSLTPKLVSFGWECMEMDGHDMDAIVNTLEAAKKKSGNGKPIALVMATEMGKGVDFMMGSHKWHGVAPNAEQREKALSQLVETLGDY